MKLTSQPGTKAGARLRRGVPAWEIAHLFPSHGHWTEADYLALEESVGNQLVELDSGRLDVLSMPSLYHQRIVAELFERLDTFVSAFRTGEAYHAPLPVRFSAAHYRMPDISFFQPHRIKDKRRPPKGADLVMEVVGPGAENRERDLVIKRRGYAKAKVREYWIIDPATKTITVLTLSGKSYNVHGVFKPGEVATSKLLKGFEVVVSDVFAAGKGK